MVVDFESCSLQFKKIIQNGTPLLSDISPSQWAEQRIILGPGEAFPGPLSYRKTPYFREIIDMFSPDHPAKKIILKGGAQMGKTKTVIIPALGWIIETHPGNCALSVGSPELIDNAVAGIEEMIDLAGIRDLIKSQAQRKRNNKTGDTDAKKDFAGGFLKILNANNHKTLRQISLKYGFFDDIESIKNLSKQSGNTIDLLEKRFAAFGDTYKMLLVSTPELATTSNIEPAYLKGDQRKFMFPCPHCHCPIDLVWKVEKNGIIGGFTWDLDDNKRLKPKSVRYVCVECGNHFDDRKKEEFLNAGFWQPTNVSVSDDYFSFYLPAFYAAVGMISWKDQVQQYLDANPPDAPRDEEKYQVWLNLVAAETYQPQAQRNMANQLQRNCRSYEPMEVPEAMSIKDGNGRIVLVTCAADMGGVMKDINGGTEDDVRIDYEVVAHAENGATYSICQGSIGTFIPREGREKVKTDRKKWTYDFGKENSVWPELDKVLATRFKKGEGKSIGIVYAGLDCGHFTTYAYSYIDKKQNVFGLKGDKEDKYIRFGYDAPLFKAGRERDNLYILQVGKIKDYLSDYMRLRWDQQNDGSQPDNFMNFPQPSEGMYTFKGFFEHFEAEERQLLKDAKGVANAARWVKKNASVQNHFWDCRVYNLAVKEIFLDLLRREMKLKEFTWKDYAKMMTA